MDKPVELTTPLGGNVLNFLRMTAREEIGRLFNFELDLLSKKLDISAKDLLGLPMTVRLACAGEEIRYFHGYVTQLSCPEIAERTATYRVALRPWLWFLTQTADCRIFQSKKVPEIIKSIFSENGFSDVEDRLNGDYRTWEYCVQYRETDFNFVSRLMEQEGISYYFKHEDTRHVLVLADSIGAYDPAPGNKIVRFLSADATSPGQDHIHTWEPVTRLQPGKYALNDFDFKNPKASLLGQVSDPKSHAHADYEVFDYPGEYLTKAEGSGYAKVRLEELHAAYETCRGEGYARGLMAGALFTLSDHPVAARNGEYLVTAVAHQVRQEEFEAGGPGPSDVIYSGSLSAISSRQPFRTTRSTPKPVVQGPQTAMVVGKSGEEIDTDQYGRVKVQFHWDRYGARNENSSCWVRVAQVWAGKNWGAMHVPRIGQEVIVDFLEGDPDQPIITGRVYNQDSMPPYSLPANKTQSGIKSRSSKGGGPDNFNEIRFEDLKGSEQMYIHAEKDQATVVENDQSTEVGHDQSITVGHDRTEEIKHDRSLVVGHDKSEKVGNDKSVEVTQDHTERIGKTMTISVGTTLTETVGINYAETVGAAMELTVGGVLTISVGGIMTESAGGARHMTTGGSRSETVGSNASESIGGNAKETVAKEKIVTIGKDFKEEIGGKHEEVVEKEFLLQAKKVQVVAQDELKLKSGDAEVTLKKNGDITIKGKKINIKGTGDVTLKGSKIQEN